MLNLLLHTSQQEPWIPLKSDVKVVSKTADRTILTVDVRSSKDASKELKTVKMFEVGCTNTAAPPMPGHPVARPQCYSCCLPNTS